MLLVYYVIPPCAGTGKNYCYWIIYLEAVHIFKVSTSYFTFYHHLHNRSRNCHLQNFNKNCHLCNCYRNCHLQSTSQQMYIMQVVLSFHFIQSSIFIKREEFIMSKRKSLDEKPFGRNWKKYSDLSGFCENVTLDETKTGWLAKGEGDKNSLNRIAELLGNKSVAITL